MRGKFANERKREEGYNSACTPAKTRASRCHVADYRDDQARVMTIRMRGISSLSLKRIKWHSAMVESSSLRMRNNPITSSSHPVKTSRNELAFLLLLAEDTKRVQRDVRNKQPRDNYHIHPGQTDNQC